MASHFSDQSITWHSVDDSTEIGNIESGSDAYSVVHMRLKGEHRANGNRRSEYCYIIRSGRVDFTFEEGDGFTATTGDVVTLAPMSTGRVLSGQAELTIINTPPWNAADES